jgi:hypothetical protein
MTQRRDKDKYKENKTTCFFPGTEEEGLRNGDWTALPTGYCQLMDLIFSRCLLSVLAGQRQYTSSCFFFFFALRCFICATETGAAQPLFSPPPPSLFTNFLPLALSLSCCCVCAVLVNCWAPHLFFFFFERPARRVSALLLLSYIFFPYVHSLPTLTTQTWIAVHPPVCRHVSLSISLAAEKQ